MSTTHNKTQTTPKRHWEAFRRTTRGLLIGLAGGLLLVVPASAQHGEAANTQTGTILGRVVDISSDPIPDAKIVLQGPAGNPATAVTKDDGSFALHDVTPGIAYQIAVTADGFADWNSPVTVEPGQQKTLTDVRLRILAVQPAVTVNYSSKEVAAQQLKAEEQQRVLGFIPNTYVVYEPHPEPLTSRMKFHLAYKSLTNPVFFARVATWAAIQQAAGTPHWPQDANGYGKRLGAGFADSTAEDLIGNAILPSLLHQDPRYFYQGSGTKWSRARHSILAAFICKGDNGAWQPNYSTWGGSLISSSISMAYYPESSRNAGRVFKNFGIGMGLHVAGGLAQEFILARFTSKGKR
jgi:Carboxypeptidase regulatory-like domain